MVDFKIDLDAIKAKQDERAERFDKGVWGAAPAPTDSGTDISECCVASDDSPHRGALKRPDDNPPDWRVLLPDQLIDSNGKEYSLHYFAEDQMNFLKIPQWRRYDSIAYAYSAGKAFYKDRMTFGIFMDRLRACKTPDPKKEMDYLGEINAMVEGSNNTNG